MSATPQPRDSEALSSSSWKRRVESRRAFRPFARVSRSLRMQRARRLTGATRNPTAEENASTASPRMDQVAVASTSTSPTTAQQSPAPTAGKQAEVLMLDSSDDDGDGDAGKRTQREGDSGSEDEADDDDEEAKDANSDAKAKGKAVSKKRAAPCTHASLTHLRPGIETDPSTYCPAAPASSSSTPAAKKSKSDKDGGAGGNKSAPSEQPQQQQKGTETPPLVVIKKGASKFEIRQKPLKTDLAQSYTTGAPSHSRLNFGM